jgi:diacylglycerol kinase (ATP)
VSHPFGPPLIIANPAAGGGRNPALPRLRAALRAHGVDHEVAVTTHAGHATTLARDAVERDGRRYLVAVGGDGTVHEVVNGMVDATTGRPRGPELVLGVVGAGSGCDLVRTFGLDRAPEVLAGHLASGSSLPVDLGRIELTGLDGVPCQRVFANIAEAGFGGVVTATAARLPARLGPGRYAAAIIAAWGRFRRVTTTITVDGGTVTEALCNVVVANGQFFGGGLQVAPRALPTDGRFNVQSWRGTVTDVVRASRQLRTGAHLARDDVREWQSRRVTIEAEQPLIIEADGEVLGRTPALVEVLPHVIALKL